MTDTRQLVRPHGLDLNRNGDVVLGVADGIVSINGRQVARGGGARWLTPTTIIYQRSPDWALETYDLTTGQKTVVDTRGANDLYAGGGVWAAWLAGQGVRTSLGYVNPSAGLQAVGADGTVVITPNYQSGIGLALVRPNGQVISVAAGPARFVHMPYSNMMVWTENDQIRVWGVRAPQLPTGEAFFRPKIIGIAEFLLYHTHDRLILQEWDRPYGYILSENGLTFSPFGTMISNSLIRVAWAAREGERPEDLRTVTVDLTSGRKPVQRGLPEPPEPPEPPQPSDPPKPPEVHMEDKSAFVKNHPARVLCGKGDTPLERAYNAFRFVAAVARDLGWPAWGLHAKRGGDFLPVVNGQGYSGDLLRTANEYVDIVASREDPTAHAMWGTPGPNTDGPETFVPPPTDSQIVTEMMNRGWAALPYPGSGPTEPTDPDPQPSDPDMEGRVTRLETNLAELVAAHNALTNRTVTLEGKVARLEVGSGPVPPEPGPTVPGTELAVLQEILELLRRVAKKFGL